MTTMNRKLNSWQKVRDELRGGSREVWLAGLGLVSTVDEVARETWTEWIAKGEEIESKETPAVGAIFKEGAGRVRELSHDASTRVEEGVTKTLERLGIPRQEDVRSLIRRIEDLTNEVEALTTQQVH